MPPSTESFNKVYTSGTDRFQTKQEDSTKQIIPNFLFSMQSKLQYMNNMIPSNYEIASAVVAPENS